MLLLEGASVEDIDGALTGFGFPVGPMTLLDEVGIDVGAKVAKVLHGAFGERMSVPEAMGKVLESGRLGRKNGKGFYTYGDPRKKKVVDETVYDALPGGRKRKKIDRDEIAERCVLQMVNEAVLTLGEGILRSARDGDVGAVFGLGFPPFRGGPFRWVDAEGSEPGARAHAPARGALRSPLPAGAACWWSTPRPGSRSTADAGPIRGKAARDLSGGASTGGSAALVRGWRPGCEAHAQTFPARRRARSAGPLRRRGTDRRARAADRRREARRGAAPVNERYPHDMHAGTVAPAIRPIVNMTESVRLWVRLAIAPPDPRLGPWRPAARAASATPGTVAGRNPCARSAAPLCDET